MNMATKTLATILLVAMLTFSPIGASAAAPASNRRHTDQKQLERLYKHHDRKMELRASVLGITADELRDKLKSQTFEQIIKQPGFKDLASFHTALIGKMKEELKARGWDEARVQQFIEKRVTRYIKNSDT